MFTLQDPNAIHEELQANADLADECVFILERDREKCNEWRAMIQRGDETEIALAVGLVDVNLPKDLSEMVRDIISAETKKCQVCPVAGREYEKAPGSLPMPFSD